MNCKAPCFSHPPSCAPASRWRQGQALRVLRNLDPAGRGRMIESADVAVAYLNEHDDAAETKAAVEKEGRRLSVSSPTTDIARSYNVSHSTISRLHQVMTI
jgi:hypothetical protein